MTNLKKDQNEFIQKINSVYEKCEGYETFGSLTEFYDEDGVVLMKAVEENKKIIISFNDSENEVFEYSVNSTSEEVNELVLN